MASNLIAPDRLSFAVYRGEQLLRKWLILFLIDALTPWYRGFVRLDSPGGGGSQSRHFQLMFRIFTVAAAKAAPTSGPIIGTQEYPQPDAPLPGIGSKAWAIRGPRSRAGLIAYPVEPPKERPIPQTNAPTSIGPKPAATPAGATRFENKAVATSTRMKVPSTSLKKFHSGR
jgi:hypothetical protein